MIPIKVCRGVAIAAVLSFLAPPMLLITCLAFTELAAGYNPANWLRAAPFGFALLTCFWVPGGSRARLAITIINALILSCCLTIGLAILLGFIPGYQ